MVEPTPTPTAVWGTPLRELPLGWCLREGPEALHHVALPHGKTFLHCADVSAMPTPEAFMAKVRGLDKRGVLFKGCDLALANAVEAAGGEAVVLSHAARIELAGYKPPHKAKNLAKKGAKEVTIAPAAADASLDALADSLAAAARGDGARIEYAYRTQPSSAARALVARKTEGGDPAGLLTLTRYGPHAWHVELLLRHPEAPAGTMEHLVLSAVDTLRSEGAEVLNLGDVPLVMPTEDDRVIGSERFNQMNRALVRLAPWMARSVEQHYNVQGLYQFKNKFEPTWEARALAGFPSLGPRDIYRMAAATGILGLLNR